MRFSRRFAAVLFDYEVGSFEGGLFFSFTMFTTVFGVDM